MSDAMIIRRGGSGGGGDVNLQSKTVTPTASGFTVTPDSGYDGLSSVIVNGDTDLKASNIKSGISIFGVTGSYTGTGFDTSNAVLKVVTSSGCSIYVTGTGYSQSHTNSEGFPRSGSTGVVEHFFSIPPSAFGTINVRARDSYGDDTTNTVNVNTAGRVYEVLCAGKNVIFNSTFGLQSGYTLDTSYWEYSERYSRIQNRSVSPAAGPERPVFRDIEGEPPIQVSAYRLLTVKQLDGRALLCDKYSDELCGLTFSSSAEEEKTGSITNKVYPTANLRSNGQYITEIILR